MFLALLELVRLQAILLRQDRNFGEIFVKKHQQFEEVLNERHEPDAGRLVLAAILSRVHLAFIRFSQNASKVIHSVNVAALIVFCERSPAPVDDQNQELVLMDDATSVAIPPGQTRHTSSSSTRRS